MANILAIDDDADILMVIKRALERQGHVVTGKTSVCDVDESQLKYFDLILLDVMMPEVDGITYCKKIRELVDCPILFLTAKSLESDIILGLNVGGDDYITKPFHIGELRARVETHLRREQRKKRNGFTLSGCRFNLSSKTIVIMGTNGEENHPVDLTKSEYEICEYLALNHGQPFSKEQILEKIYGYDCESDTAVIVEHVKNIRKKLSKEGVNPIKTVWGIGYQWE